MIIIISSRFQISQSNKQTQVKYDFSGDDGGDSCII